MKKLALRISSEALADLEKIWVYTSVKWSKEQADRYYKLITDEIEFLRSNPHSGKSAQFVRPEYRVSFVKSHIIFYKASNNQALEIIRILHQSMNIENWIA